MTHNEIRQVLQSRPELLSAVDDAQIVRRWLSACPTRRRGRALSDEHSEEEIRALLEDGQANLRQHFHIRRLPSNGTAERRRSASE
ncbi:MAG UNVERIFIED_CONTAM: hypothetical protein LVR18_13980 [Planctomycetaceae bacterium]